jgi:hypothetical protein
MSDLRPPEDETTVEEIQTPAWDRTQTVTDEMAAAEAAAAASPATASAPVRRRPGIRWLVALLGVVVVVAGSALIVSLVGGRPTTSVGLGYMPASVVSYSEIRLDLPGDQRPKLAAFLSAFPGFADQSQVEPKITDVLDRIVRAATDGKQTWSANIQPWFGGQVAIGQSLPQGGASLSGAMTPMLASQQNAVAVATITDRGKAGAWLTSFQGSHPLSKSSYNGADLYALSEPQSAGRFVIAISDKVMLAGDETAVKAAVDSNGNGPLSQDADMKAALATIDRDYVALTVMRTRAYFDQLLKSFPGSASSVLASSQIDDTVLGMVPAWQAAAVRFEDDALVTSSTNPSWKLGYDTSNRAGALLGHVPASTLLYYDTHDVGPALTALLAKFRALPETKPFFDQMDQALALVGGFDAAVGWWGDTAFVMSKNGDGTLGGGLVIQPRDAAAADRLLGTLRTFLSIAGANSGLVARDEDHNGTKITVVDFSSMPGMKASEIPAGYKAEFAWASNKDVTVVGYGRDFVASVLDAGPSSSLAADNRFKGLIGRVGAENIGSGFVDVRAIRELLETLVKPQVPAADWTRYETDIKPYLEPLDAIVQATHKDGTTDRSSSVVTVR